MNNRKIFILGLPRTGTTSLCISLLNAGFTVAHNAYTKACIEQADVIADVPVFADYQALNKRFPHSLNILLERDISSWAKSAKRLCDKLAERQQNNPQAFHPLLIKSYQQIFQGFEQQNNNKLIQSYQQHQKNVLSYFKNQPERLLTINLIDEPHHAKQALSLFLSINKQNIIIPHSNQNVINDWDNINHSNKIASHLRGNEGRKYFDD